MYRGIMSDHDNLVSDGDAGVKMVMHENYAYIGEATFLQMTVSKNCQLSMIKEKFFINKHAFVVPNGWPYKKYFDAV